MIDRLKCVVRRYAVLLLLLVASGLPFSGDGAEERTPLKSIADIRGLTPPESAEGRPVFLEAQVIRVNHKKYGVFLHDGQHGIYAKGHLEEVFNEEINAGDIVRIKGITNAGGYTPDILIEEIEVVGHQPLTKARPFNLEEMYVASIDCDWVSLTGRLISMSFYKDLFQTIIFEVEVNGTVVTVQAPYSEETEQRIADKMFQQVRFNAVVGTVYNLQRQMTGRVFFVNAVEDFKLLEKTVRAEEPIELPIRELMRAEGDYQHPVITSGMVTAVGARYMYLRGAESSLKATRPKGINLVPGDVVQVEGYVWRQPVSPALRVRDLVLLDSGPPPEPVAFYGAGETNTHLNYELVSLDVQLIDTRRAHDLSPEEPLWQGKGTLICRFGAEVFEARLPPGIYLDDELEHGSTLRLTGICHLIANKQTPWNLFLDGFWLELRGAEDIEVLVPAPWLTTTRMMWVLGIALVVSSLVLIWAVMLRKTVDRQTRIIGEKIERESVHEERQRIARELHDNLEQGLAGMAIQLKGCLKLLELGAADSLKHIDRSEEIAGDEISPLGNELEQHRSAIKKNSERNVHALKLVQGMLMHCSDESRTSIMDLRGGLLESMTLSEAIEDTIRPLAKECGAVLDIQIVGAERRLKQVLERNLLLVTKESVTNAARHAEPKKIAVELRYEPDMLCLKIEDDGSGFDVKQLATAGHFGLRGMHERVNRLKGQIAVDSELLEGTCIRVEIPSLAEWELG